MPFACRWIEGQWRNQRTGGAVEATVIGWRLPRVTMSWFEAMTAENKRASARRTLCQNATGTALVLRFGTPMERSAPKSADGAPYSLVHG